ncbi:MAG: HD-GYP domain-containing protein [Gammaproteobacteria bacterium]|nr:HD-GYP domain-containing protein [Gammaproteobacteria bacterium]
MDAHTRDENPAPAQDLHEALRAARYALIQTVHAMSAVAGHRDHYTARHQRRAAMLALAVGRRLRLAAERIEGLYLGALVHDIGKIGIPNELLTKPARLTAEEYALVKTHVQMGCDILDQVSLPWPIQTIIGQHHERLDGSGYPNALSGDAIILEARIVAVADVYQAMTDLRPYRAALGKQAALRELERGAGRTFDSAVVGALIEVLGEGPSDGDALWSRLEDDHAHTSTVVLPNALSAGRLE